uniref:(northern house mosquito) hypothetical protein n=1 Tax=Culex pipiens TaxID=7175 RepID=A0A8D8BJK9_CULPI
MRVVTPNPVERARSQVPTRWRRCRNFVIKRKTLRVRVGAVPAVHCSRPPRTRSPAGRLPARFWPSVGPVTTPSCRTNRSSSALTATPRSPRRAPTGTTCPRPTLSTMTSYRTRREVTSPGHRTRPNRPGVAIA